MRLLNPQTLTVRLALLFSAIAIITFAGVGTYLYHSLSVQLEARDDHELIGKIEQFRHILKDTPTLHAMRSDQHRFIDAAAGHDGLIVTLRSANGTTLMRNHNGAYALSGMPTVPAANNPTVESIQEWDYAPGKVARVIAAWGKLADSSERVQIIVARTASERMALLHGYRHEVLVTMLIGALLAALLGYFVTRCAVMPVKVIAKQAHSITAQRLDKRLDAHTVPVELQALVQSFNAVLDRLQDSFQRLSQFSADLAHDLRTPLYNLTMQTQVALSNQRSIDEYQTLMSSNLEEYERLSRMVESMLFLARADNAQVALNKQPLDAVVELHRIAEYFEGIAEDGGVHFVVQGTGTVVADAALFRRAVSNLVANAVRYTERGAAIRLCAEQSDRESVISVSNPGIGIDPQHLSKLFDRFYRVDQARSQPTSSAGLGLAIVQSIMRLHEGKAEVVSVPNSDTTFHLFFPALSTQSDKRVTSSSTNKKSPPRWRGGPESISKEKI